MAHCVQLKLRVQVQYKSYLQRHCSYHPVASSAKTNLKSLTPEVLYYFYLDPTLNTLNTLKISDIVMNTPNASLNGGSSTRGNKPDLYHGDRNKLEAWIL